MNFFDNLEALCKQNNTNITPLLKSLGYSTSKGTAWRKKGSIPSGDILVKIAKHFDVSVDYLLGYQPKSATPELTKEEQDCLKAFRRLTRDDQLIQIGRMVGTYENYNYETASTDKDIRETLVSGIDFMKTSVREDTDTK